MSRSTEEILSDALTHLQTMQAYGGRDLDDQLVIDAVCMRLSAGIETLATLDVELRESLFGSNWPLMWGMRNRIAHGYLLVDSVIVRQTLKYDIPTIVAQIRKQLAITTT
ncbi:MAG: DUF86 domain-containing protein [Nocardioidaceae bacterium]